MCPTTDVIPITTRTKIPVAVVGVKHARYSHLTSHLVHSSVTITLPGLISRAASTTRWQHDDNATVRQPTVATNLCTTKTPKQSSPNTPTYRQHRDHATSFHVYRDQQGPATSMGTLKLRTYLLRHRRGVISIVQAVNLSNRAR